MSKSLLSQKDDIMNRLTSISANVENVKDVISFLLRQHSEKKFDDILNVMNNEECKTLGSQLANCVSIIIADMDREFSETEVSPEESINLLRKIAMVITVIIDRSKSEPSYLFDSIYILHELLIPLDESVKLVEELKISISRICETWWQQEFNGCELFIPQLIPYLLLSSLNATSCDADVKRLYALKNGFELLDYEDASIHTIQGLLLRCYVNPLMLKVPEGIKFLAFVFTMHKGISPMVVGVMKSQLAMGSGVVAGAYGEIIYRVWKGHLKSTDSAHGASNSGSMLTMTDVQDMMQDLVHDAIHAANRKYFTSLQTLLSVWHQFKMKQPELEKTLLTIYGPILWRSLKCTNALVREQSAILFFDVFPLQATDESLEENETLLQKQFDLLTVMLQDADHRVRAASAFGVCKVLRDYWQLIPPTCVRQILSYVLGTLGVDASCANVRCAVINGLCELLTNPLTHAVLKGLLGLVSNAIHDESERVRLAFVKLLAKVKNIRGFKFYDIVSVERICDQLNVDATRPVLCNGMTELLLNSFYIRSSGDGDAEEDGGRSATTNTSQEQAKRCLKFVRKYENAACVFYGKLLHHTSVGSVAKICAILWTLLSTNSITASQLVTSEQNETNSQPDQILEGDKKSSKKKNIANTKRSREIESKNNASVTEDEDDIVSSTMSISDVRKVLLLIASMLNSIKDKLILKMNSPSKEFLEQYITPQDLHAMLSKIRAVDLSGKPLEISQDANDAVNLLMETVSIISNYELAVMQKSISGIKTSKSRNASNTAVGDYLGDIRKYLSTESLLEMYFEIGEDINLSSNSAANFASSTALVEAILAGCVVVRHSSSKTDEVPSFSTQSIWPKIEECFINLLEYLKVQSKNSDLLRETDIASEKVTPSKQQRRKRKQKTSLVASPSTLPIGTSSTLIISMAIKACDMLSIVADGTKPYSMMYRKYLLTDLKELTKLLQSISICATIMSLILPTLDQSQSQCTANDLKQLRELMKKLVELWLCFSVHYEAIVSANASNVQNILRLEQLIAWVESDLFMDWKNIMHLNEYDFNEGLGAVSIYATSDNPLSRKPRLDRKEVTSKSIQKNHSLLVSEIAGVIVNGLADVLLCGIKTNLLLEHLTEWSKLFVKLDKSCFPSVRSPVVPLLDSVARLSMILFSRMEHEGLHELWRNLIMFILPYANSCSGSDRSHYHVTMVRKVFSNVLASACPGRYDKNHREIVHNELVNIAMREMVDFMLQTYRVANTKGVDSDEYIKQLLNDDAHLVDVNLIQWNVRNSDSAGDDVCMCYEMLFKGMANSSYVLQYVVDYVQSRTSEALRKQNCDGQQHESAEVGIILLQLMKKNFSENISADKVTNVMLHLQNIQVCNNFSSAVVTSS